MKNENDLIFNSYAHASGIVELTEAEQAAVAEQQTKQKFQQQLQDPKTQQAMLKQAEELKAKYQKDIDQALQKDGGKPGANVEELLKKIQAALNTQAQQQVKESLDLQEEGVFKQIGSLASGAMKRVGDVMNNRPSDKGFRQEAILKRFQSLQKSVGSHLKELQRDMETTSNVDTKVKDAVNKTIANIEAKHGIAPTSSKFQDIRHSVGKFAQNVATGALLAAPIVALAAPVAAALGLGGAAAAAVTAGISGGSVSMLKDLITGQKPNGKRAVVTALASAATAGLFKMALDHFSSSGVASQTTPAQSNSPASAAPPTTATAPAEVSSAPASQVASAAPSPAPKINLKGLFQAATDSPYTGAPIDKPRMEILKALVDANRDNNSGLTTKGIAKVFGDWSARADVGAGLKDPQKIIDALNAKDTSNDLVKLFLKAAAKKR